MSQLSRIEQEQQAPTLRETTTGPLLPRWFTIAFYVVFVPFCIYSAIHITFSVVTQGRLRAAIAALEGDVGARPVELDSGAGRAAMDVLGRRPVLSFLYLNQELLQNEESDARMARAMALRKAVDWGDLSARRDALARVLAHMSDEGLIDAEFELDDETRRVLNAMVEERLEDPEMTYVENRITDVLAWVAAGHPGLPKGPEKRRLAALEKQLAKKIFVGPEAKALKLLTREWSEDADAVPREAADRFVEMLEGKQTQLSSEAASYCLAQAERLEGEYEDGMVRLARASRLTVEGILKLMAKGKRLDHPHIYQYLSLLSHRFDGVRQQTAEGALLLRHNRFTIRFLSYFATKTTINPFMAVETLRLTREEHEREMRRANIRRMREAVLLLGKIGVDYIGQGDEYRLKVADPDELVRKFIMNALVEVTDEESISDVVETALADMRQADRAHPGGPRFDSVLGE